MKLTKKQLLLVGFMLFSLFFGAGNLIFPPFLGNNAGSNTPIAVLGFLIPAVVLPVLGVVIVAKFNGLEKLASKVNPKFAIFFTIVIILSIGPGLGIPRAASVPFEMAIKPYLSEGLSPRLFMGIYSFIFFMIAMWLSLTPSKLLKRIGSFLTPSLLTLLVIYFVTFMFKGDVSVAAPTANYANGGISFLQGFVDGYQTMDTIAALNFGLVIANTLIGLGIKENKSIVKNTVKAGLLAGSILSTIYIMISYIGMATSAYYPGAENGALILRNVVYLLYGNFGSIVIAAIFTLACLTTCVGLITSISDYFAHLFKKFTYRQLVYIIVIFSFLICNLGLNMILSISVPVLDMVYPVSIVLILLGLCDKFYTNNKLIYPLTILLTSIMSIIFAVDRLINPSVPFSFLTFLPGYELGFGWVTFAVIAVVISLIYGKLKKQN